MDSVRDRMNNPGRIMSRSGWISEKSEMRPNPKIAGIAGNESCEPACRALHIFSGCRGKPAGAVNKTA
jgi:hypothetical protein